ncbi:MAG: hypothetical protein ACFFBD_08440 [Candidatus Hodarchaeota archaeon]
MSKWKRALFFIPLFLILTAIWLPIEQQLSQTFGEETKQGDNEFLTLDLETNTLTSLITFRESFIFGSTYFTSNGTDYLAFIEREEAETAWIYSFSYVAIDNTHNLHKILLMSLSHNNYDFTWMNGLTVEYSAENPLFSTILEVYNSDGSESNFIIQFLLNGTILGNYEILGENLPYFNPSNIAALGNGSYNLLVDRYSSEDPKEGSFLGQVIITTDIHGTVSNVIYLDETIEFFILNTTSPEFEFLTFSGGYLKKQTSSGEVIETYAPRMPLNAHIMEADIIDSSLLLIQIYHSPSLLTLVPVLSWYFLPPMLGALLIHGTITVFHKLADWRENELKQRPDFNERNNTLDTLD